MRIGITAGASTPDSVVGEVIERVLALRGRTAGDLTPPAHIAQGSSTFAKATAGQAELRMIGTRPTELTLTLAPQRRFEAIDVNRRIAEEAGDILRRHRRALYTSFHTTAGYLDQSLSVRLHHRHDLVSQFFRAFHALFPQGGEYRHDQMHLRSELTDEQKVVEPRNGDSHLTFIGAGMRNCVTYRTRPDAPVYFIELDGKTDALQRQRKTTVVAYDHDEIVARTSITHSGVEAPDRFDQPRRSAARAARARQRARRPRRRRARRASIWWSIRAERNVGLTVNEYETLLMQNDLVDVLRDPLRFARIKAPQHDERSVRDSRQDAELRASTTWCTCSIR